MVKLNKYVISLSFKTLYLGLAFTFLGLPSQAQNIIDVQTSNFYELLDKAKPGDVFSMAPGDYSGFKVLHKIGTKDRPITFTSADPSNPARIHKILIRDTGNIIFDSLVFDITYPEDHDPKAGRPFLVERGENLVFNNILIDGDAVRGTDSAGDGYGYGFGLMIRWTKGVRLENSTFINLSRGVLFDLTSDIIMRNNEFTQLASDGSNFVGVRNVLIEGNYFHNFVRDPRSGHHPDMIQFWTNNAKIPSTDVIIRNNVIYAGKDYWTQSIFMRNESVDSQKGGRAMFYRNISITGNVIINDHLHGITLGESENVNISNNTLVRGYQAKDTVITNKTNPLYIPSITVKSASDNVTIKDNIVATIRGNENRADWNVSHNLAVDTQNASNQISHGRLFADPSPQGRGNLIDYAYIAGGPADAGGYGSSLLKRENISQILKNKGATQKLVSAASPLGREYIGKSSTVIAPQGSGIRAETVNGFMNVYQFFAPDQNAAPPTWQLPDGKSVKAKAIEVTLQRPGKYIISMQEDSGKKYEVKIRFDDPSVLLIEGGKISGGNVRKDTKLRFQGTEGFKQALPIGLSESAPQTVSSKDLIGISRARFVSIAARVRVARGQKDPSGVFLYTRGGFSIAMTPTGGLIARWETEGSKKPVTIRSRPLKLHDGEWHDIELAYNDEKGAVILLADGDAVAGAKISGGAQLSTDLKFGAPRKKKSFEGFISKMHIIAQTGKIAKSNEKFLLRKIK